MSKQTKQTDDVLDNYLKGDSALSRAYAETVKAEVPEHLDKNILAAANAAVKTQCATKVAYSPFTRHWSVPASMAAVLVLCVGLVFTIYKDSGQTLLTAPKSEFDTDNLAVPMAPAVGNRQIKSNEAKQSQSGLELMHDRSDASERVQAADVKQQKQDGAGNFERRLGDIDRGRIEQDVEPDSDQLLRNKWKVENLPAAQTPAETRIELLNKDALKDDKAENEMPENRLYQQEISGEVLPETGTTGEGLARDESMNPEPETSKPIASELWLKQINELWLSGEKQLAKENLRRFVEIYPDYSVGEIRNFLNQNEELLEAIK